MSCSETEPLLEDKHGGTLAACHYPLTEQEVATQLPAALTRRAAAGQ